MMKRLMWLVVLLLPATVVAQENTTRAIPEGIVIAAPAPGAIALSADTAAQAPAASDSGTRRRPSMVGYVNDSTIASQFRIRFDSGRHITSPDRAEFFYGKCGCYRGLPSNLNIFDPKAAGPGPGILSEGDFQQLYFMGEYAMMHNRGSVFVEVPLRWLKPDTFVPGTGSFAKQSGVSDLRFGTKLGLMSSDKGQATVQVQATTPTGDSKKGLGTGHSSIEPALLMSHHVNDKVGIEAQFGAVFPIGGSPGLPTASDDKFAGRVLYYGVGPSFDIYSSDTMRVAPVIELVGWRVLSGFRTVCDGAPCFLKANDPSGNIVNLKVGARIVAKGANSIYFGYGRHLTDEVWYEDIFRFEFRRSF